MLVDPHCEITIFDMFVVMFHIKCQGPSASASASATCQVPSAKCQVVEPAVVDLGSSDRESVGVSEDDVERPDADCEADHWTSVLRGLGACGGGLSEKD